MHSSGKPDPDKLLAAARRRGGDSLGQLLAL